MPIPILATKLFVPQLRKQMVSRSRLVEKLTEGLSRKLTLISAPAGFGKTTLLSECAQQWNRPIAWVSLDERDNDITRFLSYFISALQIASENFGKSIFETLNANQSIDTEFLLSGLINEIVELPNNFMIVLDDYHVITNPEIHEILTYIVENQPPQMHLVISSRADPPWPLARWRVSQEMTEVRTQDLRFTPNETTILLNNIMQLDLSLDDVLRLENKTEGWVAGLLMAAISIQGRKNVSDYIQNFESSHRFIFDYLIEEVLNQLPQDVQVFLLKTSILERLCPPLCDAILNRNDSQSILLQLEQLNLFIFPMDDSRYWYRYHQLFSDLLVNRLNELEPDDISTLHHLASIWYENNNYLSEAVNHALSANDYQRAAQLAEANIMAIMDQGEMGLLIQRIKEIPVEIIDDHPWLRVAQAWALTQSGSFDAAIPCLTLVDKFLIENPDFPESQANHIAGHLAAIRCYIEILSIGNYNLASRLAQQALEALPQTDMRTRGMVTVYLGTIQRIQLDIPSALETLNAALGIYRTTNQIFVIVDILSQIARLQRDQGLLHETVNTCQEALRLADHFTKDGQHRLPSVAYSMGILGRIYYEWDQLDKAIEIGSQAIKLSARWGQANTMLGNYLFMAKVYQARGELEKALEAIHAAKEIGNRISDTHAFVILSHEMGIQLALGNIDMVENWVKKESKLFTINESDRFQEMTPLNLALFRLNRIDSIDELLVTLNQFIMRFEEKGVQRRSIIADIQKAMILQMLKDYDQALLTLEKVLIEAEYEGFIRSFIDQGAPMADLLKKAISVGIKVDYCSQLLSKLQSELGEKIPPQNGEIYLIDPLTDRETMVLRLLATELTISKIADELVITTGTLRTHIKRIYRKLGAHSRFEAIIQAKKLNLL